MSTGRDARGLDPPIFDRFDAVGGGSSTTILQDKAVLAGAADPLPASHSAACALVHNSIASSSDSAPCSSPPFHVQNESVANQGGSSISEHDCAFTASADPHPLPHPDILQMGAPEPFQNGISSASAGRAGPSISGQNEAIGDESCRMNLEYDAVLSVSPDPRRPDALVLVHSGPAGSSGPPTGIRSVRGRRRDMEDAVCAAHSFLSLPFASPSPDLHYFAVYDGHGGAQVALHCREHMHLALAEEIQRCASPEVIEGREAWENCMKATFVRMDREVALRAAGSGADQPNFAAAARLETVGSTAVVAVLSCYHIIVANCGDSRAVLCRRGQAIPLSQDHKPDREDELARIEAAGGRVFNWNGWRVLGVLAMSRAIGDHYLKPYVIADPDMTMTARSEEDECLILASDGLWDTVSNQDACTIARRLLAANRDAQTIASALVQKAHEKGSSDNISVVFVDLRCNKGNLI